MPERYSYPEFIDYCSGSGGPLRSDGEIIWYNRIPVPAVLVKKFFYSADQFLTQYTHHLLTATIISLNDLKDGSDFFSVAPNPELVDSKNSNYEVLCNAWERIHMEDVFTSFMASVSELCGMGDLTFSRDNFIECLRHNGKKYQRLYIPQPIKMIIDTHFRKVSGHLQGKNGDMFGNVFAENLNIYKSGFSDAFAGLFNKYLDFKLENFPDVDPRQAKLGQMEALKIPDLGEIFDDEFLGGNLWEPELQQGGLIGLRIDRNHPINFVPEKQRFDLMLSALSSEEMTTLNEDQKSFLEEFRYRVSKRLSQLTNKIQDSD